MIARLHVICLLACVVACAGCLLAQKESRRSDGLDLHLADSEIRVTTWNVHHAKGDLEKEALHSDSFAQSHILCVQESNIRKVAEFSRRFGYNVWWQGSNFILSRAPIVRSGVVRLAAGGDRGAPWADVQLDTHVIARVYSIHLPFANSFNPFIAHERRRQIKRICRDARRFIDERKADLRAQGEPVPQNIPVIIAGDFNNVGWLFGGQKGESCIKYVSRMGYRNLAHTRNGSTHGMLGKLDWIFALGMREVGSEVGRYAGSDHIWLQGKARLDPGRFTQPKLEVTRGIAEVAPGGMDAVGGAAALAPLVLTYTLKNTGGANLLLATPLPAPANLVNCAVTIDTQPANLLREGQGTTFTVTVIPQTLGTFSAQIGVGSNDPLNRIFGWTLSGTCAASAPVIGVAASNSAIANGAIHDAGGLPHGVPWKLAFRAQNLGLLGLNLTGAPSLVALTRGANISSVTVSAQPAASISALEESGFELTVIAASAGPFDFLVSIDSNDGSANPFTFTVTGTGVVMAVMEVARGQTVLPPGTSDALGTVAAGELQLFFYDIANRGNTELLLPQSLIVSGLDNCSVTVTIAPDPFVVAQGATLIAIKVRPHAPGPFGFTLSLATNDPAANPFFLNAEGTALALPMSTFEDDSCTTSESARVWPPTLLVLAALAWLRRNRSTLYQS